MGLAATEDMVIETTFPERRAELRAVSRPTQAAFVVALLSVVSVCVTYALLTGLTHHRLNHLGLIALFLGNLVLILALAGLLGWRLVRLWATRRSGGAGAKLHTRLVTWFSTIAVAPAILVAVFSLWTLNLGLDSMFSRQVKGALSNAVNVAQTYVYDHAGNLEKDAVFIADALQQDPTLFDTNHHVRTMAFISRLAALTRDRGLRASYILDSHGTAIISTQPPGADDPKVGPRDLAEAQRSVYIDLGDPKGKVTALVRLTSLNDAYLMVMRAVDPKVVGYYKRTINTVSEYNRLNDSRLEVQLVFVALYGVVTMMVLLAAVWSGLWAANRLVQPISHLVDAAEKVSSGDLSVQVRVEHGDDELGTLGAAFNRMTQQLTAQRGDLMAANRLNETRRLFTETVLSGVSAGVVGIDQDGNITIVNRAAARLLNATPEDMEGRHYSQSVPELAPLILRAMGEPVGRASGEVAVQRTGSPRSLSVQVTGGGGSADGFVVTFDDITDLVSAQRTAAWADVARRIAHEIKNPLTPIQLSAERLKRKYASEIVTDPDVFNQCTDTIVRQVGDIGRMVDEFSSFARMPTPTMRRENAQELLQQALFLQRVANPAITFATDVPKEPVWFEGDGRLISQALTNVLKNAGEGIAARIAKGDDEAGKITIAITPRDATFVFRITDNGIGLPPQHKHRLTEPYVTTRAKGTGLGLAIVRKIMEDHGGEIVLADVEGADGGAEVTLTFPYTQKSQKGSQDE